MRLGDLDRQFSLVCADGTKSTTTLHSKPQTKKNGNPTPPIRKTNTTIPNPPHLPNILQPHLRLPLGLHLRPRNIPRPNLFPHRPLPCYGTLCPLDPNSLVARSAACRFWSHQIPRQHHCPASHHTRDPGMDGVVLFPCQHRIVKRVFGAFASVVDGRCNSVFLSCAEYAWEGAWVACLA